MDKELLLKIKSYIELMEEKIDAEYGLCRDYKELIAHGQMPEIYDEVLKLIK